MWPPKKPTPESRPRGAIRPTWMSVAARGCRPWCTRRRPRPTNAPRRRGRGPPAARRSQRLMPEPCSVATKPAATQPWLGTMAVPRGAAGPHGHAGARRAPWPQGRGVGAGGVDGAAWLAVVQAGVGPPRRPGQRGARAPASAHEGRGARGDGRGGPGRLSLPPPRWPAPPARPAGPPARRSGGQRQQGLLVLH